VLEGWVDATGLDDFVVSEVEHADDRTTLTVELAGASALRALLMRIDELGVILVELRTPLSGA
jgi:hypothetical protein